MSLGRIVIVEDEAPIREGIAEILRAADYDPIPESDGESGLAAARRPGVDLVLLDLRLPKMDGMDVLKALRRTHAALPIIILTARGSEDDRVSGLKAGADDFVVKPFSARELIARVEAVLRRSPERPVSLGHLYVGRATVDFERREVRQEDGTRQRLSEMECAVLSHLAAHPNRTVSREELLARVWGLGGGGIETRTIDMHVARLRAKLSTIGGGEGDRYIETVRGKGYTLGPDVRRSKAPDDKHAQGNSP